MAKKITQYPASSGNPDAGSLFDVSELSSGTYTTKKITLAQLLSYMNANLTFNTGVLKFKNLTGATIVGGSLVSISGADANAKVSKVTSKVTTLSKLYVAVNPVTDNTLGDFLAEGVINNLNTNAFPVGTLLFWDSVNQTYTNTLTSGFNVFFGVVLVQSSSVGSIYASPAIYTGDLVSGSAGQVAIFQATDKVTGNSHFTFVDNLGTEIGYRISDGLNNLTQVGISYVNVETEGNSQSSVLRLANWSDGINTGLISFRKSRGTKATPTKVLANDVIANQIFTGQADKIIDNFGNYTTIPSGMTTCEVIVRAINDYIKAYEIVSDQTISSALTQYEIWLQSANANAFGDFTPANTKVFSVDGNGKVYFKDYRFPANAGATGQILVTDGIGNLTWQNTILGSGATQRMALWSDANTLTSSGLLKAYESGGLGIIEANSSLTENKINSSGYALRSKKCGSVPIIELIRANGTIASPTNPLANDDLGMVTFRSQAGHFSKIVVTATENHDAINNKMTMAFLINNGMALQLLDDRRVRISDAYTLPLLDGSNGTSLITDGAGNVAWGTPSASASTTMQTIGRNSTGATLYKGTIVSISGSTGNRPNFVKAQADSEATSAGTFGVVISNIPNNSDGYVATIGTISNLDTRPIATNPFTTDTLVDGDTIYLSPTNAGYITNVKPSAPNHLVYLGKVVETSPTNGTIVYRIQNGYELEELHNVAISSVQNDDVLQYESSTQLWKNKPLGSLSEDIWKTTPSETFRGISFNNNSTTVVSDGGVTMSSSASTLAQSVSSTNLATKQIRLRYYASTVSGGRYTGTRGSALLWYIHGGFRFVCDFNISDTAYSAGCQQFYGMGGVTTDLNYGGVSGTLVSTLLNIVGVGSETNDANLQIFHNSATGTATKIDLGANFPANRTSGSVSTSVYQVQILNLPMSSEVRYKVINKETGDVATGVITTNLPLTSQGLNFFASRCMSTTSVTGTGQFDLMKLGVYSIL